MLLTDLICDRSAADVEAARTAPNTASALKGAYNISDRNRVGKAVNALASALRLAGYANTASAKADWAVTQFFTEADGVALLDAMTELRRVFCVRRDTPGIPSTLDAITWQTANDIERILRDIGECHDQIPACHRYCGETVCGVR